MLGRPSERREIHGYLQVGPSLGAEDPLITYEQADALRHQVAVDFFDAVNVKTSLLDEHEDKSFSARSFKPAIGADDLNDTMLYGGAMLHQEADEFWRMKILATRSARMSHNMGEKKIQTRYFIGAIAGRLVLATKLVKAVRDVGEGGPDLIASGGSLHRVRRAYEKHMTPDDCELLHESLDRMIKRAKVLGSR